MNCPKCDGPTWDNRAKKASGEFNPKSPDFSCKDKSCKGAIWPPKNGEPTSAPPPSAYRKVEETMHGPDERENRIQRQHSQEMALRFFALNGTVPNTKQLRDMTSWFFRDIGHTPEEREHTW